MNLSAEQRACLLELIRREEAKQAAAWAPYPNSPQERALNSTADVIGYGGQAGGGKSDLLLGLAITQHTKGIIFRREYPLLRDLIGRSREIIGERARFNSVEAVWRWPGAKTLEFGAVQYEHNVSRYRGRPHDFKGFDELTEFSESQFRFLTGWLRTTIPGQRCRVVATFNPPTDKQGEWVIGYFAPWVDRKHPNPAKDGELRWYAMVDGREVERPDGQTFEHNGETIQPTSRTFFSARLADNPRLMATGYGRTLQSLPEPLRSQLLHGDFTAGQTANPWQLIPTAWVEAAMKRWRPDPPDRVKQTCVGADVAHGGKDKSVNAARYGDWIAPLDKHEGKETPDGKSAAAFTARVAEKGATINVDAIGYGASAAERLRERPPEGHGLNAVPVNVAAASKFRDRSGRFKMKNVRAEMYWRLREALDPEFGATLALPDDPELLADLTEPTYEITPSGIQVESKDAIKERLRGRSPDCGDAVALTMLEPTAMAFL